MPYYRCLIPKNSLDLDQRNRIAKAFTDVHCGISAAPRSFVHVAFLEVGGSGSIADSHGSGILEYQTPYFVAGGNRAGRSQEVREQILNGLIACLSEIASVSTEDVSGHISEVPASWTMEGGQVLPEPGEESAEWYGQGSAPNAL